MCELFLFFDRLYLYCIGVHETFGSVIPRTKVGEADTKREHPPSVLAGSIREGAYGIQSVFFVLFFRREIWIWNDKNSCIFQ
ncbi:hypothetical protein EQJ87_08430 [Lactococcus kimchii]|nr:hypothetical protein EQJ87_08430 [Lactococcus sp. S-13]